MVAASVVILAGVVALSIQTGEPPKRRTGAQAPHNDPVTMRGCLEGARRLRILEHDSSDVSGITVIRLKGAKGVMAALEDSQDHYVELIGRLDVGRSDRLDTRKKFKVGSKTTISAGAAVEQSRGEVLPSDPVLEVDAFTPLGERCPGR